VASSNENSEPGTPYLPNVFFIISSKGLTLCNESFCSPSVSSLLLK
jgi:hypothetical protein